MEGRRLVTLGDVAELGEKETAFFRTDTWCRTTQSRLPRKRAPYEQSEYMETWLSGRKHLTANEAGPKSPPGFESLRLRSQKNHLRVVFS